MAVRVLPTFLCELIETKFPQTPKNSEEREPDSFPSEIDGENEEDEEMTGPTPDNEEKGFFGSLWDKAWNYDPFDEIDPYSNKGSTHHATGTRDTPRNEDRDEPEPQKRKRGRPKGSKNKPKAPKAKPIVSTKPKPKPKPAKKPSDDRSADPGSGAPEEKTRTTEGVDEES